MPFTAGARRSCTADFLFGVLHEPIADVELLPQGPVGPDDSAAPVVVVGHVSSFHSMMCHCSHKVIADKLGRQRRYSVIMPYPSRTDRRSIVSAASTVLDERGLDDLSLRAIAAHLGVRQPALYHHFASKAELLDAVADEILDRWHTDRVPVDGERWDAFVVRNARSLRRAMLSVRDGARLIASAGSRSPRLDNAIAQVTLLEDAGFSSTDAVLALIAVSRYTIGSAIEQQTSRDGGNIVIDTDRVDDAAAHIIETTQQVVALGQDHEFETGLAALIRGLHPAQDRPQ